MSGGRRAAKLTLPYRDVQRAKLVLYAADGLSNTEIAARLEMCSKVVGQWRRRFAAHRLVGLADQARSGRPRRFPPGADRRGQGGRVRAARLIERGITDASVSTIVRWLHEDAIRPWQYRSWIFPTDPEFATKAGRILDLYQGRLTAAMGFSP